MYHLTETNYNQINKYLNITPLPLDNAKDDLYLILSESLESALDDLPPATNNNLQYLCDKYNIGFGIFEYRNKLYLTGIGKYSVRNKRMINIGSLENKAKTFKKRPIKKRCRLLLPQGDNKLFYS